MDQLNSTFITTQDKQEIDRQLADSGKSGALSI